MRKILGVIFLVFLLIGCSNLSDKKYCEKDSECAYFDEEGSDCVNIEYGKPDVIIYDYPMCVCDKQNNECILERCETPPCILG